MLGILVFIWYQQGNTKPNIEIANHIGVDKSAYSKLEKGTRRLTIEELQKMAILFNMTTDSIINFDGDFPKEVFIEDKAAKEQLQLIAQMTKTIDYDFSDD